jgi:hypothetical protein
MKKIFMLTAAVALCLCVAMPATAKVHVGGLVALDFYYHRHDSDGAIAGAGSAVGTDDWQQLEIEVPGHTRLNGRWVNDDGNVGMFIELGLGGPNGATGVTLRHAYGWWQINPMFKLVAGHTDKSFATLNPGQLLGMNAAAPPGLHIIGIGFGNLYEGRVPQLRLETKFNDMITWKIAAADNRQAGETDIQGNEESVYPRVDTMLALNFGPVYIEPGFSWSKHKHDEGSQNIGAATSWNTFVFALGFKFGVGPFSMAGEGVYGRNMANGDGWAAFTPAGFGVLGPEYDNQFDIENSEDMAFWLDAGFKVGPADIHLIYGLQDTEGFIDWFDGTDWREGEVSWTRQMVGVSVPITVARVFIIRPEVFYYDWGDMDADDDWNAFTATQDIQLGHEWVAGVVFMVVF